MGFIIEPEGVDFIVHSTPPSTEELKRISDFISKSKEENGVVTWAYVIAGRTYPPPPKQGSQGNVEVK